jgi:hypothetical protein
MRVSLWARFEMMSPAGIFPLYSFSFLFRQASRFARDSLPVPDERERERIKRKDSGGVASF